MPQGLNQVRPIDPILESFSLEYRQQQGNFVADNVAPWLQTPGDTGTYYVAEALNNLRFEDPKWSYTTGAQMVDSRFTSATFRAQPYALAEPIPDAWTRNWLLGGDDLRTRAVGGLMDRLMIARERRIVTIADALSTHDLTGTAQWDSTAANPRANINTAKTVILKTTAQTPNSAVITGVVWDSITGTQSSGSAGAVMIDAIKYTQAAMGSSLTAQLVASYLGLDNVYVAKSVQQVTTAYETTTVGGTAGLPQAGVYIWPNDRIYVYVQKPPAQQTVNWLTTFGPDLYTPDSFRKDELKADVVRVTQTVVESTVCSGAAYAITDVLST